MIEMPPAQLMQPVHPLLHSGMATRTLRASMPLYYLAVFPTVITFDAVQSPVLHP
jgi:hypothetical protein